MSRTPFDTLIEGIAEAFREGDPLVEHKPSESANVSIIQHQFRCIALGDFDGFAETLADDIDFEIVGPVDHPFTGRWRGREALREGVARNFSVVEQQRHRIESVVAQGDTVVLVLREQGRFRTTGRHYDVCFVQVFTFRDGKAVRIREYIGPEL